MMLSQLSKQVTYRGQAWGSSTHREHGEGSQRDVDPSQQ